eukprot:15485389-Alexandrium_andersonii.AAC.1
MNPGSRTDRARHRGCNSALQRSVLTSSTGPEAYSTPTTAKKVQGSPRSIVAESLVCPEWVLRVHLDGPQG